MYSTAGEVYEATHHGSEVAVKVLQIKDERTMLDACHEFGQLHNLRHSKLVVSYGASIVVSRVSMHHLHRLKSQLQHKCVQTYNACHNKLCPL